MSEIKEQEILEGNKLIAKFMTDGKTTRSAGGGRMYHVNGFARKADRLEYHYSWDWLMPVVEKMEDMGYCFHSDPWSHNLVEYTTGDECVIFYHQFDSDNSKIQEMYYAVIEFIKWYNQ